MLCWPAWVFIFVTILCLVVPTFTLFRLDNFNFRMKLQERPTSLNCSTTVTKDYFFSFLFGNLNYQGKVCCQYRKFFSTIHRVFLVFQSLERDFLNYPLSPNCSKLWIFHGIFAVLYCNVINVARRNSEAHTVVKLLWAGRFVCKTINRTN